MRTVAAASVIWYSTSAAVRLGLIGVAAAPRRQAANIPTTSTAVLGQFDCYDVTVSHAGGTQGCRGAPDRIGERGVVQVERVVSQGGCVRRRLSAR